MSPRSGVWLALAAIGALSVALHACSSSAVSGNPAVPSTSCLGTTLSHNSTQWSWSNSSSNDKETASGGQDHAQDLWISLNLGSSPGTLDAVPKDRLAPCAQTLGSPRFCGIGGQKLLGAAGGTVTSDLLREDAAGWDFPSLPSSLPERRGRSTELWGLWMANGCRRRRSVPCGCPAARNVASEDVERSRECAHFSHEASTSTVLVWIRWFYHFGVEKMSAMFCGIGAATMAKQHGVLHQQPRATRGRTASPKVMRGHRALMQLSKLWRGGGRGSEPSEIVKSWTADNGIEHRATTTKTMEKNGEMCECVREEQQTPDGKGWRQFGLRVKWFWPASLPSPPPSMWRLASIAVSCVVVCACALWAASLSPGAHVAPQMLPDVTWTFVLVSFIIMFVISFAATKAYACFFHMRQPSGTEGGMSGLSFTVRPSKVVVDMRAPVRPRGMKARQRRAWRRRLDRDRIEGQHIADEMTAQPLDEEEVVRAAKQFVLLNASATEPKVMPNEGYALELQRVVTGKAPGNKGYTVAERWVVGGRRVLKPSGGDAGAAGPVFAVPQVHGGGGSDATAAAGDKDSRDPNGHIAHEFNMLDLDGNGFLSPDELFEGLCQRGWDQDEIQGLFEKLDANGDGQISFDEYLDGMSTVSRSTKEHSSGLRRLGMNLVEALRALKAMWSSVDPRAPMRVVDFKVFKEFGAIPRSSHKKTVLLSELPNHKVVFISHRWFRPWQSAKELREWFANKDIPKEEKDAALKCSGMTGPDDFQECHPDDAKATKHKLICRGVEELAEGKGWNLDEVAVWVDFCGIEQDDVPRKLAGVNSLRGYVSVCDAVLVPAPEQPEEGAHSVDAVPGGYGARAWTRLEALCMYTKSVLMQVEAPEIWVAASSKQGPFFFKRFDYVLSSLPSKGVLFSDADRKAIEEHEKKNVEEIKATVARSGYITKHSGAVQSTAFHPKDPWLVVSAGDDGVIKLVNRETGTARWSLADAHGCKEVKCVAFNSDGTLLASGGGDNVVRVWDVSGPSPVEKGTLSGHSSVVTSVAFSPDFQTLASASYDKTVKLWDLSGETPVEKGTLTGHSRIVFSVAWNHDGTLIASGSSDNTVRLWSPSGEEKGTLRGHSDFVYSVAFSPDGKTLASASRDNTVKLWDLSGETPVEKGTLKGHSDWVFSVAFSPDSKTLASASSDKTVKLWDLTGETPKEKGTLKGHSNSVTSVAFSPDGKTLASASWDKTVKLWDPMTMEEKGTLRGHSGSVNDVAFSPDGSLLASASDDKTVKLWDPTTMEEKGTLKGHSGEVLSVAFSPDGKLLASARSDGTVKLWDPTTMEEEGTLRGHSEDNPECTCCHGGEEGEYEANPECPVKGHDCPVLSVAFSPDGNFVASASGDIYRNGGTNCVKIWNVETMEEKGTLTGHSNVVSTVAFSPDSKTLASASYDKTVKLWDLTGETPKEKGTLRGHSGCVNAVAFSPDGKLLASASDDETVKLWDPTTMEEKGTLRGHLGDVNSVAFSCDGSLLASASDDETVQLWDPTTMEEKGTLKGSMASWQHLDPETKALAAKVKDGGAAGANRTGQYIVTAEGGMVHVYKTKSDGEKQGEPLACFRSPATVRTVCCRGTSVVVGCKDWQVLFLEAPLLAVG